MINGRLVLHINIQETQGMLKAGGQAELYQRMVRDAVILFAVREQKDILKPMKCWLTRGGYDDFSSV